MIFDGVGLINQGCEYLKPKNETNSFRYGLTAQKQVYNKGQLINELLEAKSKGANPRTQRWPNE